MKAILINSETCQVTEVEYTGNWESISTWIGNKCDTFTCVQLYENGDTAYVDDEGLFNGTITAFKHENYPDPLVGNALILGTDETGESVDVSTPLSQVQKDVFAWGHLTDLASTKTTDTVQ